MSQVESVRSAEPRAVTENSWWYALLAAPVGLTFALIAVFGVNIVFEDSWNTTVLALGSLASGHLSLAMLWAPHNENRMLFPNLIFLLTDLPSHYNATVDMYIGAAFLTLAMAGLCWLIWRSTGLRGLWLLPIGVLLLDPAQIANTLWDFQLAWSLITLLWIGTLCCIELSDAHPWVWTLAAAAAIVASYSSLQGLLVWPAALVYLWARGGGRVRPRLLWAAMGVAISILYVWNIGQVEPASWSAFPREHPLAALRFFLIALGNYSPRLHTVTGALALLVCIIVGLVAWRLPAWRSTLRVPLVLMFVGVAFAGMIAYGRAALGPNEALSSRYVSYTVLVPLALYTTAAVYARASGANRLVLREGYDRLWSRVIIWCALVAVVLQLAWAVPWSISQGAALHSSLEQETTVLRHYRTASDAALQPIFAPGGQFVKEWAPILQRHGWSVFQRS